MIERRTGERELAAMRQALALGELAVGMSSPNPPVGCVILGPDGAVAATGVTQPAGKAHAEVEALAAAGPAADGGTAVVTLEPCGHTGRTGPCARALIEAGIRRVVYAVDDPHPAAHGGAGQLREAGVEVHGGLLADQAAAGALRYWLTTIRTGRPYVTAKWAETACGRAAARDGTSRWITGPHARHDVHSQRAEADAIVVGANTVLVDNPHLTVRHPDGTLAERQPLRVVLDRTGLIKRPGVFKVFDNAADTVVLNNPDITDAFATLALGYEVLHVWLEGGPTVLGAAFAAKVVDRVLLYWAPVVLGEGTAAVGPAGVPTITRAHRLRLADVARLGPDLRMTLYPPPP